MSAFILPIIFIAMLAISSYKRVNCYECFVEGAKQGLKLIYLVFPYITAVFVAIALFKKAELSAPLTKLFAPFLNFLGIPHELTELIILRPLSGNGSLALLTEIYQTYGADTYIARVASVIMGSSETVFYISSVYFSTTKVKNLRAGIPICLVSMMVGVIFASLLCRIM